MRAATLVLCLGLMACNQPAEPPDESWSLDEVGFDDFQSRGGDPVQDVVRQNRRHVRSCYEQRLQENPNLDGRVELGVRIEEGRVVSVDVVENTTRDDVLGTCIARRVQRWDFGADTSTEVRLPFAMGAG